MDTRAAASFWRVGALRGRECGRATAPDRAKPRPCANQREHGETVSQGNGLYLQALPVQFNKKRNQEAFERASEVIKGLARLDHGQQCELLYFDESGFSPNPPVQSGWSRIGQTRSLEPLAHRQRVNVLGALRHDGKLTWATQQRPTTRNDVIAFFDQIAAQPHEVPRIVVLDNAGIHKGDLMDKKRRQWAKHGLYLYYLPPYSPELNRIEILWKHAKQFWRRFVSKNGTELLDEVQSLMKGFGSKFTINFV